MFKLYAIPMSTVLRFFGLVFTFLLPILAEATEYRLPDHIAVTKQAVNLTIRPGEGEFSGETTITLSVSEPTDYLAIHNNGLTISEAAVEYNGQLQALQLSPANRFDIVRLLLQQNVIGEISLTMAFTGHINNADNVQGLFMLQQSEDLPYVFSQFQEMEARRVFPSLDAPDKKTSFSFTLNIPAHTDALHNTHAVSEQKIGTRKIIEFAPTPLMNTDVLALAIGRFIAHPLPETGVNSTLYSLANARLTVPDDLEKLISYTVEFMQDYLDSPFPYSKLDIVVAPLGTLAAMENVGLIALNTNQLPDINAGNEALCDFRKLIAHEVIHMWFGNAITMQSYDDFWLNESFTEFFAAKVIQQYSPNNKACTYIPQANAFRHDNPHAQPLKRSIKSRTDAEGAGQTYYTKGRALLEMIGAHAGPSVLQRVFREYVARHYNGNVITADFTGLFPPNLLIPEIVESFTEQSGFPLLSVSEQAGQLVVSQQPYFEKGNQADNKRWVIPITLKSWNGSEVSSQKLVLNTLSQSLDDVNPQHSVFIDGNGAGYFRYIQRTDSEPFPLSRLSMPERLAAMDNSNALAQSGRLDYQQYTDSLLRVLNDLPSDSLEVEKALDALNDAFIEMIPASLQRQYARYLKSRLPGSLPWQALIQQHTGGKWLQLYGLHLESEQAIEFANRYFSGRALNKLDQRLVVLRVVTKASSIKQYRRLLTLFKGADNALTEDLLDALGYVPSAEHTALFYGFLLSDATQGYVIDYRFQYPAFQPALRQVVADYFTLHRQRIAQRIPDDQLQWFPYNFITACSESEADMVSDVFTKWLDVPGLQEKLDIVVEHIKTCSAGSQQAAQTISFM